MPVSRPTLLMTRPRAASQRFVSTLPPALMEGVGVITSPLIRIDHVGGGLELDGVRGVIFTSANGVHAASAATDRRDLSAFCVGLSTTQAATEAGWTAHQSGTDANSLITALLHNRPDAPLLHIRGRHARGDVAQNLTKQGLSCADTVLYDQSPEPFSEQAIQALGGDGVIVAPVFSPRTARLFAQQAPERPIRFAALSPAVADELRGITSWQVDIAPVPDAQAMRVLVEKLLQSAMPG